MPASENARHHWSAGPLPCHIELSAENCEHRRQDRRRHRRMRAAGAFSSSVISNSRRRGLVGPREGTRLDQRVRATFAYTFQGIRNALQRDVRRPQDGGGSFLARRGDRKAFPLIDKRVAVSAPEMRASIAGPISSRKITSRNSKQPRRTRLAGYRLTAIIVFISRVPSSEVDRLCVATRRPIWFRAGLPLLPRAHARRRPSHGT